LLDKLSRKTVEGEDDEEEYETPLNCAVRFVEGDNDDAAAISKGIQIVELLREAKRQKITVAPFAATFPRRTLLSSSRWVNKVPHDIWVYKIFQPFLDLKALSTLRRCNTFFEEYWQYVLKQNVIRVPE
jgi:hypothetical protein